MNSLKRMTKVKYLVPFVNSKWLLNVYCIQSNESEKIETGDIMNTVEQHLKMLENDCISSEFEYFRTGFAFLHYGNRGIDLTIWHVGKWGKTYEVFNCSWYCYGRDLSQMELLDSAEPSICQYELLLLGQEFNVISEIIQNMKEKDIFRKKYCEHYHNVSQEMSVLKCEEE